jgi:hypothetical protein
MASCDRTKPLDRLEVRFDDEHGEQRGAPGGSAGNAARSDGSPAADELDHDDDDGDHEQEMEQPAGCV